MCRYAVDTFRWYICRDAIFGCDLSFSKTALVLAHNSELCNTFGNMVHRSLSLMAKYNAGPWKILCSEKNGFVDTLVPMWYLVPVFSDCLVERLMEVLIVVLKNVTITEVRI